MGKNTVEIELSLGVELRKQLKRQAKAWGISEQEFICNALDSRVRAESGYRDGESFVRHGGRHLFGKYTGYEVTKDGKYYPAPTWVDQFNQLLAEREAVHRLANTLIAVAQERLIAVEKGIQKAKSDLITDLGLDPSRNWAYYGGAANYLQEEPKSEEQGDE